VPAESSDEQIPYGQIFPFTVSQTNSFIVTVANDGFLRVNTIGGEALDASTVINVNPDFTQDNLGYVYNISGTSVVTFPEDTVQLRPSGGGEARIRQFTNTPDQGVEHTLRLTMPFNTKGRIRIEIGGDNHGDIMDFTTTGQLLIERTFIPNWPSVNVRITALTQDNWIVFDRWELTTTSTEAFITFPHDWSTDTDIREIQVAMPASDQGDIEPTILYMVSPRIPPHKLTYDRVNRIWSFGLVNFVGTPPRWELENWPGVIGFYQGRMWLAATPDQPESFWGSASGEFEDFTPGGTEADDQVAFGLDHRGRIEWLVGSKNLLIGTENAEFIATSESGVIKAGDIQVTHQSSFGSASAMAEQVGNQIMYISADGRKIREMGFQWTDEGYVSRDLTFIAEHLTGGVGDNKRLVDIAWVQNPDNLLWGLLADGTLICATYERSYEIIGWHRHHTPGDVLSIAVVESYGESKLWVLTRRNNILYLETIVEGIFQDSFKLIDNEESPSASISVPHLAFESVQVIADGAVHQNITLDSNGDGILDAPADIVIVGLFYDNHLKTLPLDVGSQTGSGRAYSKGWSSVYTYLIDSHLPLLNGERSPDRTPATPMDTAEPRVTGFIRMTELGYDEKAQLDVSQDLPLSCVVGGFFGELDQGIL